MITPEQLRAARGLLDWSRGDLSKASGISQETIKNIEHGVFRPQEATEKAILKAFAAHDVRFIDSDGVQKRTDSVKLYKSKEELRVFLDAFFEAAKKGTDICAFGIDDKAMERYLGDYSDMHTRRMGQLNGNKIRCLVKENGDDAPACSAYGECRSIPPDKYFSAPFYIYGTRLAFILTDNDKATVASMTIPAITEAYRRLFESLWSKSASCAKKSVVKESVPKEESVSA